MSRVHTTEEAWSTDGPQPRKNPRGLVDIPNLTGVIATTGQKCAPTMIGNGRRNRRVCPRTAVGWWQVGKKRSGHKQ